MYNAIRSRLGFLYNHFVYLIMFQAVLGLLFGIVIEKYYGHGIVKSVGVFILISLMFGSIFYHRSKFYLGVLVLGMFLIIGGLRFRSMYGYEKQNTIETNFGREIYTLLVMDNPIHSEGRSQFTAITDKVEGKVRVSTIGIAYNLKCGDVLRGRFLLESPPEIEAFDYAGYLQSQGIYYTVRAFGYVVDQGEASLPINMCKFKTSTYNSLYQELPSTHAALVAGILWGERSNFSEDFERNLSRTGTTHIIAVSGFNVSIIVLILLKLAGLLPRKLVIGFVVVFLFLFLMLVGFDNIPAFRAGIMGYIVLLSKTIGRRVSVLNLISGSLLILLLVNPAALFTVSFHLSFAALVAIISLTDPIKAKLNFMPEVLREEFSATLAAIILTSPISIYNFGTLSLVAPVVNLIVLPFIPLLMLMGFIFLLLTWLPFSISIYARYLIAPLFDLMMICINFFGDQSFSAIELPTFSPVWLIIFYIFVGLIIFERAYRLSIYGNRSNRKV